MSLLSHLVPLEQVTTAVPLGVRHIDMPTTPMRVWAAIRTAAEGRA